MIDVFESFATRQEGRGALVVTRRVTPTDAYTDDGYQVTPTGISTFPIIAQVTPTSGRNLQILADQGITSESRTLWTSAKLTARDDGLEPDTLTGVDLDGDGVLWTVFNWKRFTAPDGDVFYQVIVARGALK